MPLPLGDAWPGFCHAREGGPIAPGPALLVSHCHLGYVRGRCAYFPKDDAGADAIRFVVRGESAHELHLYYVMERDHHPFGHGPLQYSVSMGRFAEAPANPTFARQAEAYVESYLRRQREASGA